MGDPRRRAIDRFASACEQHSQVVAAFLGGSLAAGTDDEFSDLDLYVVTEDDDYARFSAGREDFMRSWCTPVFLDVSENFEGFGFDMLHFVLVDGVTGEVALGHRSNMLPMHGGPYEVLVDKASVLGNVTFPLYEPSAEERRAATESALHWFWLDAIQLAKHLGRDQLGHALASLGSMRDHLELLMAASARASGTAGRGPAQRLLATFTAAEPAAIGAAAQELFRLHREVGAAAAGAAGQTYPAELANVAEAKLSDVAALARKPSGGAGNAR